MVCPIPSFAGYANIANCGTGSYGAVYSTIHQESGEPVAIKVFHVSSHPSGLGKDPEDQKIQIEIDIHKALGHPFIARFLGDMRAGDHRAIVMERVDGLSLLDVIVRFGAFSEEKARSIFAQVVSAVHYLHRTKKVIHADLKLENILITSKGLVKLVDYGFARWNTGSVLIESASYPYASPEIVLGLECTELIDVWSLGVVLYTMMSASLPFGSENDEDLFDNILDRDLQYPDSFSEDLVAMLKQMLAKSPEDRVDIEGVKNHKWLQLASQEVENVIIPQLKNTWALMID
jgi:serine/threonine protein kinase